MGGLDLLSILDSRPLLLAICEQVAPSMNGAAARRLAAVMDEISLGNGFVDPADETWLLDAAANAERLDRIPFWKPGCDNSPPTVLPLFRALIRATRRTSR